MYPSTQVRLCIVHLVRNRLTYVSWKDRKQVARNLRTIYQSATLDQAENTLDRFAERCNKPIPAISRQWRRNWDHLTSFFAFPQEGRKVIDTANAIESMNRGLGKIIKTRGDIPTDDAARKPL